ncbi:MAG: pectin acetylesterase-family hydrolase [Polyangiales bacterium]
MTTRNRLRTFPPFLASGSSSSRKELFRTALNTKYFVNFADPTNNPNANNLVIYFEPGGACWDYESCTQDRGIRGAANTECIRDPSVDECIPDSHVAQWLKLPIEIPAALESVASSFGIVNGSVPVDIALPVLSSNEKANPMYDWTKVFVSYCTGDVHTGSRTVVYKDPTGVGADVEFHHVGHDNVVAMMKELNRNFPQVPKMMATGCSAGGAGAITNYYFIRNGLEGLEQGFLLDDAGPIFPDQAPMAHSLLLHDEVRTAWDAEKVLESNPAFAPVLNDFGALNSTLAAEFPQDRFAITYFQQDYNYSLYSYERFNMGAEGGDMLDEAYWADRATVYRFWDDDTLLLRNELDPIENFGYYLPTYRDTNDSHCATIPGIDDLNDLDPPIDISDISGAFELVNFLQDDPSPLYYVGSDMSSFVDQNGAASSDTPLNMKDFIEQLLDTSTPLKSYFETDCEGRYQACTPRCYDAGRCEMSVTDFEGLCATLTVEEQASFQCPPPPT